MEQTIEIPVTIYGEERSYMAHVQAWRYGLRFLVDVDGTSFGRALSCQLQWRRRCPGMGPRCLCLISTADPTGQGPSGDFPYRPMRRLPRCTPPAMPGWSDRQNDHTPLYVAGQETLDLMTEVIK